MNRRLPGPDLFALGISDTYGVKVLRADVLRPSIMQCALGADRFDTELILRAERAGFGLNPPSPGVG